MALEVDRKHVWQALTLQALTLEIDSTHVGHGGQQQASASSAKSASTGGNRRARPTQDGGMGRILRQRESLVAGGGSGTDSSEDTGAGRKKG